MRKNLLKRILLTGITGVLFSSIMTGCAMYHLQTPETVPVGKLAIGGGALGAIDHGEFRLMPGMWARTGISPRMDVGIHAFMLGLKANCKYAIVKDYLAAGLGGGLGMEPGVSASSGGKVKRLNYTGEASLYLGYPLMKKTLYPYTMLRALYMGGLYNEMMLSAVGGIRVKPCSWLSTYIDAGIMHDFDPSTYNKRLGRFTGAFSMPIFGAGISFNFPIIKP